MSRLRDDVLHQVELLGEYLQHDALKRATDARNSVQSDADGEAARAYFDSACRVFALSNTLRAIIDGQPREGREGK